jgi:hypothetical protein
VDRADYDLQFISKSTLNEEGHGLSSKGRHFMAGSLGAPLLLVSAFLFATTAVPAALADDPPPPTTTVIATSPTPDPPPPLPKPKPKPKPKPTPQPPAQTPPHQFSPPSTPSHAPAVVHVTKPVVKKSPPRQHVKPKKKAKAVAKPKPATVPTITVANPVPATAGLQTPTLVRPDGSTNVVSLLILLGLSFAIVCLGIAVVPAPHVPWRPAAIFVSERQVDLTVIGAALLLAAALTLFWTGA